nr:unnamed protein product [Spirometra erinaceieuropaei]
MKANVGIAAVRGIWRDLTDLDSSVHEKTPARQAIAYVEETSVHILDLAKLEPILQSQQNKIVAKLVTIYNSLTDSPDALRLLVRARWHPTARGVLFLLTRDGFLHLLHCDWNASGSLSVKTELQVSVLRTLEAGHKLSTDKESIHNNQRKGQMKLNLNFALGAVCSDFDIGSPLFTADVQSLSGLLSSPVYVLCENGDILMVSPSSNSRSEALVRVVRIIPSAEDCYTFDFDSILCMSSTGAENSPDVLCIASRSGRIFHGIILHVPAAVLLESDSISHGIMSFFFY